MIEPNMDATLPIPCPNCGEKATKTLAQIKDDPIITCAACGKRTKWDAEGLWEGIERTKKSLEEFRRTAENAFKKR